MGFSRQEYQSELSFLSPEESFQPRDRTPVSHIAVRCLTFWATREAPKEKLDVILIFTPLQIWWIFPTSDFFQNFFFVFDLFIFIFLVI